MPGPYNFWVQVSDFHYQLPQELIAQEPLPDRSASRLLHLERASGVLHDRCFRDFPELLRPDDLVVFNNTRVFPARLYGSRSGSKSQRSEERRVGKEYRSRGSVEHGKKNYREETEAGD